MALQSLILPILSVFRSAGLQQASGVLRKLTGDVDSLAGKLGLAAGSFSAFSALTSARQFTIDSVNATAQFERNLLGLQQVFKSATPQLKAFVREVENYGLSQAQAAQASVFLGSVLKQYGFTTQESADQTERLVTLAQDLATTYGYDVQEALLAITALFRGEYDPIEKFGVAMKQSEVSARLAAEGLDELEGPALANAQATARLTMLFERANDAVGAFARASDTLYASQQRLNAVMGNLQLAFGEPLQKPLAEINNIFADLAQEFGPEVVQIGEAIGGTISTLAPLIKTLGTTFLILLAPLQQVVEVLNIVLSLIVGLAAPMLDIVNNAGSVFINFLNMLSEAGSVTATRLRQISPALDSFMDSLDADESVFLEWVGAFSLTNKALDASDAAISRATTHFQVFMGTWDTSSTMALNGVERLSVAQIKAALSAETVAEKTTYYADELKRLGVYSEDTEENLIGLAAIFDDIGVAAEKSKAADQLELIGFNASQIEYFLTRPDWAAIFGEISRLAKITAIDIATIPSVTAAAGIWTMQQDAKKTLELLLSQSFGGRASGGSKKAAKDTVKDFFTNLKEEIQKQTIREKLSLMGASEALVDAILGSEAWMKLWQQIKTGTLSLGELEKQFRQTAAGIAEFDKRKAEQADWDAKYKQLQLDLADAIARIREKAEEAKGAITELLASFAILPTIEREVGRFEAQMVQMLASIEDALKSALNNKDILLDGYNALREFARKEIVELQNIGRQRDEFAKRYDLAEGLIDNYKKAFTAAFSLTSLFGKLKDETEKRTVTVVTSGIVRLGSTLREFGVTITKSFEEPIANIQSKSEGLLQGFRNMAEKARGFAKNLRELQQMGLNDTLFNELVQAGVEAGGETAQALVDGGSSTINEINSLFDEINTLGAGLGEEAAATLYGSGIDMMDGILAGIRSKQEELENTARALAEAFNREFQSKFNIQVGIAQAAAEAAARADFDQRVAELGPRPEDLPKPVEIDMAAFSALDKLITNATKYADAVKDATKETGALAKLEVYKNLQAAVLAGQAVNLTGIQAGLSSQELQKRAAATNPTVINNTFNVAPGNTAQQIATVETLNGFVRQNGSLLAFGIS